MSLHCSDCKALVDLDEAPDTGECPACGGPTVEAESERNALTQGFANAIVGAVSDGIAAAGIAKKRLGRGQE